MKKPNIPFYLVVLFFASCEVSQPINNRPQTTEADNTANIEFNSPHPASYAVIWHQTSGEYEALCRQAFYLAKQRLLEIREQKGGEVFQDPVVVMDVDETLLDNSPYFAKLVLENKVFTSESWKEWTSMQQAEFVPGALDFLQHAKSLDFPVYFISNRDADEVESTIRNMERNGYEVSERSNFLFKEAERDKTTRRELVKKEHDIVLLIGDNLLDFSEVFASDSREGLADRKELMDKFGKKFIIVPNAMYGEWLYDKSNSGLAGDELTAPAIQFRKSKIQAY